MDDAEMVRRLREIGDYACLAAADYLEQLLIELRDQPDVVRRRLEKLASLEAGRQYRGVADPERIHLDDVRSVARSLIGD